MLQPRLITEQPPLPCSLYSQFDVRYAMVVLVALLCTPMASAQTVTATQAAAANGSAIDTSTTDSPVAKSEAAADTKITAKPRLARGKDFAVTPAREAAVFAFAEQYHPELVKLLKHLQQRPESKPYHRAIRELFHTSERLAALEKSDPERYALALQAWQARSRVQLLSAKLSMSDREQFKRDLKTALTDQFDVRTQLLELDRKRLGDRLQRIETDLNDHTAQREAAIEKQLQTIVASGAAKANAAGNAKSATVKGTKRNAPVTVSEPSPKTTTSPQKPTTSAE